MPIFDHALPKLFKISFKFLSIFINKYKLTLIHHFISADISGTRFFSDMEFIQEYGK